jgi:16S rRNA (cytosine967-C5)-methyltransferase
MKTASSKLKVFHYQHHLAHVKAVYQTLQLIFEKDHYADQALEKVMRANKKWGVKDRSFVSDTVYDMVRNWRLLLVTSDVE